jgi:hypothetical protein
MVVFPYLLSLFFFIHFWPRKIRKTINILHEKNMHLHALLTA